MKISIRKKTFLLIVNLFFSTLLYSYEPIHDIENDESDETLSFGKHWKKELEPLLFVKAGGSFLTGSNICIGLDLLLAYFEENSIQEWLPPITEHMIGIDYQYNFSKGESVMRINYQYFPFYLVGVGINSSYNINKNYFILSPMIGISIRWIPFTKFDINYRYNCVIKASSNNYHEIAISFGIFLLDW